MKFSPYVIDLLKQKSNKDFRLSGDCEYLALDIESVTGEHIGVNTLKRLLGFIDDEREPRPSTLDIIARYLDFENWDLLKCFDDKSNSFPESVPLISGWLCLFLDGECGDALYHSHEHLAHRLFLSDLRHATLRCGLSP